MNFRSAGTWAHLPSSHRSNWKSSLRTNRTQTNVQERFRSKWRMVRRSSIQQIPTLYLIRFSVQSTTNLNTSVLRRQSGCWMLILFVNHRMTTFQATNIRFQACPELSSWRTRFGPSGSLWGDGFGMLTCQEHWWRMKWVLERLSPWLQLQWFANWWLRKMYWGCHCPFYGGIPLKSRWFWRTTTFPALSVKNGSGIRCTDWILYPAAHWRSRPHHLTAIQCWYQHLNQSWW